MELNKKFKFFLKNLEKAFFMILIISSIITLSVSINQDNYMAMGGWGVAIIVQLSYVLKFYYSKPQPKA